MYLADCAIRKHEPDVAVSLLDRAMLEAGDDVSTYPPIEVRLRATAVAAQGDLMSALELTQIGIATARDRHLEYDLALLLLLEDGFAHQIGTDFNEEIMLEVRAILARLEIRQEAIPERAASQRVAGVSG
jgi:hypothetical protein